MALARSAAGARIAVPGTDLEVQALTERTLLEPGPSRLLLVNEGRLIVDLPGGEFRVLVKGDSLMLPAATALALQPVAGQAVLTWHHPR